MSSIEVELRQAVDGALSRLRALDEAASRRPPAPGKWCAREVLGHLIDSASNNHGRVVRAQLQDDLCFEGYDQDAWVRAQRYGDVPFHDLLELWRGLNLHLAHVIEAIPVEVRTRVHRRHSLDRIAWRTVPAGEPTTLDYFLGDYVAHLRHHLASLAPA